MAPRHNRLDHIRMFERLVVDAKSRGEEEVKLPMQLADQINLELAKTAKKKKPRGRPPLSSDAIRREWLIIAAAQGIKYMLMKKKGMSAKDATERAAELARRRFGKSQPLSTTTIMRKMDKPENFDWWCMPTINGGWYSSF